MNWCCVYRSITTTAWVKSSSGTWRPKVTLNPTKDPGDTFLERGHWSAYDSAKDTVWFFNPGAGAETPPFEMDIYALDLTTGMTTSYMNVDDSVSLFLGDSFGDKAIFMNFAAQASPAITTTTAR